MIELKELILDNIGIRKDKFYITDDTLYRVWLNYVNHLSSICTQFTEHGFVPLGEFLCPQKSHAFGL